jgi:hypothetical protein
MWPYTKSKIASICSDFAFVMTLLYELWQFSLITDSAIKQDF